MQIHRDQVYLKYVQKAVDLRLRDMFRAYGTGRVTSQHSLSKKDPQKRICGLPRAVSNKSMETNRESIDFYKERLRAAGLGPHPQMVDLECTLRCTREMRKLKLTPPPVASSCIGEHSRPLLPGNNCTFPRVSSLPRILR